MKQSSRYGAKLRKLANKAEVSAKSKYECPKCKKKKVVRKGYSLWQCRSCGAKIAGGAFSLTTESGEISMSRTSSYSG